MIVKKIKARLYYKKSPHNNTWLKGKKISIYILDKEPLTIEQEDKITKFFESL